MRASFQRYASVGSLLLLVAGAAQATLFDRGNGLIYDSDLNVTWLQDTMYASTSGADGDGLFDWDDAAAWVSGLAYAGFEDWRLPNISPVNGSFFNSAYATDGSTDYGFNIAFPGRGPSDPAAVSAGFKGNELAYMFHVNLENLAFYKTDGTPRGGVGGVDWGWANTCFENGGNSANVICFEGFSATDALARDFWTSLVPSLSSNYTKSFKYTGFTDSDNAIQLLRAWAVRDGDVLQEPAPAPTPIPAPSTLFLLVSLIPGLAILSRRLATSRSKSPRPS